MLTDEAIRNRALKKISEKRGNNEEPSRDGNVRNDNKRVGPRVVNPLNARNPNAARGACFECGGMNHCKKTSSRLNRAPRPGGNRPNQAIVVEGRLGRGNNADQARGRTFMIGVREARQDLNIVTGTFTLESHYATTLFDYSADYSSVSTTFMPLLDIELSHLHFSYKIKIASGQLVEINKVIRGFQLEIKGHTFDIDLIPFGHESFDVSVGMDWLSRHKAKIVCHEKVVRIPLPNSKMLRVLRERPEERLPPSREIEFCIDLIPGAIPVAKSPYCLAPSEMEELSSQLRELQDKGMDQLRRLRMDKGGRDDNNRTKTGNVFSTTANPVGRENTGHFTRDCRVVPRSVNPINVRNPTLAREACYKCGSTDHLKPACPRLNRAQGPGGNHTNPVVLNNEGQGHGNQGNQARGMDLLSNHKAKIIFHEKVVRMPLLGGKVLRVLGKRPEEKVRLLMSVMASDKKQEKIVVVRDFPKVFLDDLSGLPPLREIKFWIELIPRAVSIAKSPYRLAPSKLEELSGQLKELHDKGLGGACRPLKLCLPLRFRDIICMGQRASSIWIISRWIELFSDYDCENRYHPGKANVVADALSKKERVKPKRVPLKDDVRTLMMDEAHKSKYVVHPGADKMYYELRDRYWWPGMKNDIAVYSIKKALGTRLDMSTTYHPQTDGQSEHTIHTLEDMLRACVLDFEGSLGVHLLLVEFSYNNSYHSSVRCAPFEALYGRKSRLPIMLAEVGEEPVEILEREFKKLRRSRIAIVKFIQMLYRVDGGHGDQLASMLGRVYMISEGAKSWEILIYSMSYCTIVHCIRIVAQLLGLRFFVIVPNDLVAINSIIESMDAIFDDNRYSLVPRPSLRISNEIKDTGGSVVLEKVVQQLKPELRKKQRNRNSKNFGPKFQLYLIEGTRDEAINDEMDSIMGNNTWVLADLPLGCKPLGCKWIFKRKPKVDGTIKKFKVRLVIQGFKQKSKIDYFDTYAPVAHISTIRLLVTMASIHNLIIHQMDVKTDFLNGDLEEEVYMNQLIASSCLTMKIRLTDKGIFVIKVLYEGHGKADVILGIRIKHESNGIEIAQPYYIKKAISQLEYSRMIGCLMYAMTCTRPDIAFDVGFRAVLDGYANANWISNTKDNSSTCDWVFLLGGVQIAPIFIRYDSAATLANAYSQMYNGKSRHLGLRHSMIRELITNEVISIEFVKSQQNLTNKGLARDLVIESAEGMELKSD
nr:zinc finger, CCHC-type [Tanacetum cinerariifolium]